MFKNQKIDKIQELVNQVTSANNADDLNTALVALESHVDSLAKDGYGNYIPDIIGTIAQVRVGDATRRQVQETVNTLIEAMHKETMIEQMATALKENATAVARMLVDSMFGAGKEKRKPENDNCGCCNCQK